MNIFKSLEGISISTLKVKNMVDFYKADWNHRFVLFFISLILTYCLFVEKKLVTIKHFLLNFLGGQSV